MPAPLIGAAKRRASDEDGSSRQHAPAARFMKPGLTGLTAALMLCAGDALAICPCGDGICGGDDCFPPETSQTCPADCGAPPPPPPPPPAELTVRVTVLPFGSGLPGDPGDPGRFNLHIDNTTIETNLRNGESTGPHTLSPGAHTLSETAGSGTKLADYRRTICGACSSDGAIQPGIKQSCTITNLRLPTPAPAFGCRDACFESYFECSASGESPQFCLDVFNSCLNRCQIPPARRLGIARFSSPGFPSVNLSEVEADGILAEMSNVLRHFDGPDDIECNAAFCRDGAVEEYAIDDGVIDSEAEMNAVAAVPQDIKVARNILFCGGLGAFNGCRVGNTFIVRRLSSGISAVDGINWAHEYGHVRGLGHRVPDDPNALMTNGTLPVSNRVNPRECTAFRSGFSSAAIGVTTPEPAAAAGSPPKPRTDIRDFVRQLFLHGIPYEEATRYGSDVVPALLDMLGDPREEQAWPNIVIVLGMLGDERAVAPLMALVEQNPGRELSTFQYDAKINAILALGYLVNRRENQRALSYLRDGSDPAFWEARGIAWTSPEHESPAERNRGLSRAAIIGLGLSGNPSAEKALDGLLTPASTPTGRAFRENMRGVIREALRANRRIAGEGLANYYRTPLP